MKKQTVTLGIPAYNEEGNIKKLLESILRQEEKNIAIKKIIVISDGSTDSTVQEARTIKDPRLKVVEHKNRRGQLNVQNEILRLAKEDVLVLLNADILPLGNNFVDEIIKPILNDKAVGLVGVDIISAKPEKFIENIISVSHELKCDVYKRINNSANVFLCHGRARAFSKEFYKKLVWLEDYPEDAYSYLLCIKKGFKFAFAPQAKVLFRSPATLSDHIKQSTRFYGGKKKLELLFSPGFVRKQYEIPKLLFAKSLIKYLFTKPLEIVGYFAILFYIKLFINNKTVNQTKWEASGSTKRVAYEK